MPRYTFRLHVRALLYVAEVPPRERTIIAMWKRQFVSGGARYYVYGAYFFISGPG